MTDLKKLLKRIIHIRRTPSELVGISSEMRTILDDLFEDGSYTLSVLPDKYTRNGIGIELDARVNGCKIKANCAFCMEAEAREQLDEEHPEFSR